MYIYVRIYTSFFRVFLILQNGGHQQVLLLIYLTEVTFKILIYISTYIQLVYIYISTCIHVIDTSHIRMPNVQKAS